MDGAIDIKSLEEAVTVFYRSGAEQQSNAHDWLTKAQLSPQAWSFVWELMQLGKVICAFKFNLNSFCPKKIFFCECHNTNLNFKPSKKIPCITDFRNSIFWCHHITYETFKTLA